MPFMIDSSRFPLGDLDYYDDGEVASLELLSRDARGYIESFHWAPPLADLLLAFGIAPKIGLFLARFTMPIAGKASQGDNELWIVVGDLPSAYFVIDDAYTPADALEAYCELMMEWIAAVITGRDLSQSYPVEAEPTMEHAEMLESRIEFVREKLIPQAR